jgi:hypothetical protein
VLYRANYATYVDIPKHSFLKNMMAQRIYATLVQMLFSSWLPSLACSFLVVFRPKKGQSSLLQEDYLWRMDLLTPATTGNISPTSQTSPNPLPMGFLKTFSGVQKKVTRGVYSSFHKGTSNNSRLDGQPPKRRGPKPDSKPAQTRRQELNRQAQR